MIRSNGPICSSQKGWTQPPNLKSSDGSSSGPPGACMTPSSDRKTAPVSLRIGGLSGERGFDLGDVDLAHVHHRLKRALGRRAVRIVHGLEEYARRDLPREAPLVLAPAAHAFLAAVLRDRVPVAVGLRLIFGDDHEADRFIGLEVGAAVEADERLAKDGEVDRQFVALLAAGKVR